MTFCDAFKYCKQKQSRLLSLHNFNKKINEIKTLIKIINYLNIKDLVWVRCAQLFLIYFMNIYIYIYNLYINNLY